MFINLFHTIHMLGGNDKFPDITSQAYIYIHCIYTLYLFAQHKVYDIVLFTEYFSVKVV